MFETSLVALAGGSCQALAISSTSATSAAIRSSSAVIYATVECFMRRGAGALSDGTDQYIPATTFLRVAIPEGTTLAFKTTSASGTVYIAPGA